MRPVGIYKDQIYHIYNRGINRQRLFFEKSNWLFFIRLMKDYFQPKDSEILAYCLMPNHFHFLVHIKCENFGNKIMMPFTVSYTKSINRQEKRVGPIFQGTFKAKLIDSDNSLLHVSRYIHLNPIRAGLVGELKEWEFSSYLDYIGERNGTIPNTNLILSFFQNSMMYKSFIEEEQLFSLRKYVFDE